MSTTGLSFLTQSVVESPTSFFHSVSVPSVGCAAADTAYAAPMPWLDLGASSSGLSLSEDATAVAAEPPTPSVNSPKTTPLNSVKDTGKENRECSFCKTKTTPMWRHGPVGFALLCNGCGVKWKRGRILTGLERAPKTGPLPKATPAPSATNKKAKSAATASTKSKNTEDLDAHYEESPSTLKRRASTLPGE